MAEFIDPDSMPGIISPSTPYGFPCMALFLTLASWVLILGAVTIRRRHNSRPVAKPTRRTTVSIDSISAEFFQMRKASRLYSVSSMPH